MNKMDATIKAVEKADQWMGGAVVVVDDDGENFDAIPGAYLTDISYSGARDVVIDLSNGVYGSTGYNPDEASAEEIAKLLVENEQ